MFASEQELPPSRRPTSLSPLDTVPQEVSQEKIKVVVRLDILTSLFRIDKLFYFYIA